MEFKSAALVSAAAVMMAVPSMAQDIKIGFVTTLATPAVLIGKQQQKGADLAMNHLGNKMTGKSVNIFYEDDGLKPKTGNRQAENRKAAEKR